MRDFYEILNIDNSANTLEIKKAYKLIVLEHHPDRAKENYNDKFFQEIKLAYEILSDPESRKAYDKYLSLGMSNDDDLNIVVLRDKYYDLKNMLQVDATNFAKYFKDSKIEFHEFVSVELCYYFVAQNYKIGQKLQYPEHLLFYLYYKELEPLKRFDFEEALIAYAVILEKEDMSFYEFLPLYQDEKNKIKSQNNESKNVVTLVDEQISYDGHVILTYTIDIKIGEFVSIIGKSGSGKTSILRKIIDTIPYKYAYLEQDTYIQGDNTTREIIKECDNNFNSTLLLKLGIQDLIDMPINRLSGGQKMRVKLAKVISEKAEIVILDEPTQGLDVESSRMVFETIKWYNELGNTVIISSHDRHIEEYSKKTYLIEDKKLNLISREKTQEHLGIEETKKNNALLFINILFPVVLVVILIFAKSTILSMESSNDIALAAYNTCLSSSDKLFSGCGLAPSNAEDIKSYKESIKMITIVISGIWVSLNLFFLYENSKRNKQSIQNETMVKEEKTTQEEIVEKEPTPEEIYKQKIIDEGYINATFEIEDIGDNLHNIKELESNRTYIGYILELTEDTLSFLTIIDNKFYILNYHEFWSSKRITSPTTKELLDVKTNVSNKEFIDVIERISLKKKKVKKLLLSIILILVFTFFFFFQITYVQIYPDINVEGSYVEKGKPEVPATYYEELNYSYTYYSDIYDWDNTLKLYCGTDIENDRTYTITYDVIPAYSSDTYDTAIIKYYDGTSEYSSDLLDYGETFHCNDNGYLEIYNEDLVIYLNSPESIKESAKSAIPDKTINTSMITSYTDEGELGFNTCKSEEIIIECEELPNYEQMVADTKVHFESEEYYEEKLKIIPRF